MLSFGAFRLRMCWVLSRTPCLGINAPISISMTIRVHPSGKYTICYMDICEFRILCTHICTHIHVFVYIFQVFSSQVYHTQYHISHSTVVHLLDNYTLWTLHIAWWLRGPTKITKIGSLSTYYFYSHSTIKMQSITNLISIIIQNYERDVLCSDVAFGQMRDCLAYVMLTARVHMVDPL